MSGDLPPRLEVDLAKGVRAAFTVARASDAAPDVHNLSTAVGDGRGVRRRRAALAEWIGAPVVHAHQVHGTDVLVCPPEGPTELPAWRPEPDRRGPRGESELPRADAVVATGPDVAVAVLVADCVPVLLADARGEVVAAVHAGRRGVVAGVVGAAVAAMRAAGARDLGAAVGPAACGACYEVPAAMRAEVAASDPAAASTTAWGTPALDLPGAVVAQLRAAGVRRVLSTRTCTIEDPRWFSHRASGATGRPPGRFAALIRARAAS